MLFCLMHFLHRRHLLFAKTVGIHTKKRGCWQFGIEEEGKKVNYVPVDKMEEYLQGELDVKKEGDKFASLGSGQVKVSVAIKGLEDTEPYYVGTYSYAEDMGYIFWQDWKKNLKMYF